MKSMYINGDINKGIAYDWKQLRKDFEALDVPPHVYTPINNVFYRPRRWYFTKVENEETVYKLEQESPEGGHVVYCDTDSIYVVHCE